MVKRFLSLRFPRLPLDRHTRARDGDVAVQAIVEQVGNRHVISHVSADMARAGVKEKMTLSDALALVPALETRPAQVPLDERFLKTLARYCYRYTPLIAFEPPDHLLLDVTGCTHLFGGDEALVDSVAHDMTGLGVEACASLAPTPRAARAFTRAGRRGAVIASNSSDLRAHLAALPVHALGLETNTNAVASRLGLTTIGALYAISRASLRRRFGNELVCRLFQALGAEPEPVDWLTFKPPYKAEIHFAEPLLDLSQLSDALARILTVLCARIKAGGAGARQVSLTIERVEHTSQSLDIGLARASYDERHMLALFEPRLNTLEAPFGIDALAVVATRTQRLANETSRFVTAPEASRLQTAAYTALIDRLSNRLGFNRVVISSPNQTHIPERATTSMPAQYAGDVPDWPPAGTPRPIVLFATPVPLPGFDMTGFMLDSEVRTIASAQGPERIEPEWWWDDPAWRDGARDYWWIETTEGMRLWVFRRREGSHWQLHGIGA